MEAITTNELAEVLTENHGAMYALAYGYLQNHADAQDAVGDATLKALENKDSLKKKESARAWVMQIVANCARNILRKNKRVDVVEIIPEKYEAKGLPSDLEDKVFLLVGKLEEPYREAIILKYYRGYSVQEIAKQLSISEGTVKSRLSRGRDIIRKRITSGILCLLVLISVSGLMTGTEQFVELPRTKIEDTSREDVVIYIQKDEAIIYDVVCFREDKKILYLPQRALTEEEQKAVDRIRQMYGDELTEVTTGNRMSETKDTESIKPQKKEIEGRTTGSTSFVESEVWSQEQLPQGTDACEYYMLGNTQVTKEEYSYYCSDLVPTDERASLEEQPKEWQDWKVKVEAQQEEDKKAFEKQKEETITPEPPLQPKIIDKGNIQGVAIDFDKKDGKKPIVAGAGRSLLEQMNAEAKEAEGIENPEDQTEEKQIEESVEEQRVVSEEGLQGGSQ